MMKPEQLDKLMSPLNVADVAPRRVVVTRRSMIVNETLVRVQVRTTGQ
ncbi:hypothetical protein [Mycobacterium uberis]|nr:hypothetical protein [Mycobacterium uberis]